MVEDGARAYTLNRMALFRKAAMALEKMRFRWGDNLTRWMGMIGLAAIVST